MSRVPTLFMNKITVLDFAALLPDSMPIGFSFYVDVRLGGAQDSDGILMDFGLAKKALKEFLDRFYDHCLYVHKGQVSQGQTGEVVYVRQKSDSDLFLMRCPNSAVQVVPLTILEDLSQGKLDTLEKHLEEKALPILPSNVLQLKIKLYPHEKSSDENFFSYTHSLKFHYGNCQRFHGHSNVVEVYSQGNLDFPLSQKAARLLDKTYLIDGTYLTQEFHPEKWGLLGESWTQMMEKEPHLFVEYSGNQGEFGLVLPKRMVQLMPSESSIENISQYVFNRLRLDPQVHQVFCYEGLQKGAIFP